MLVRIISLFFVAAGLLQPARALTFESLNAAFGLAPVLMIGNEVFGKVTKDQLPEIIAKYRNK